MILVDSETNSVPLKAATESGRCLLVAVHDHNLDSEISVWNRFPSSLLEGVILGRRLMPGDDPKEARQHALTFVRLAQTSAYPPARERYAKLANTWLRLAAELENRHGGRLLDRLNEYEPIRRTA
jgi:hypothetical protein